jgi:F-type H+-transporting ATPase subunit gamma
VKRELELRHRLQSLRALGEAVGAMKSLSAHHFREARQAVEDVRQYRDGVVRISGTVGAALPAGQDGAGLVVIGAELGLCGSYNSRIVEAGVRAREDLGLGPTFCVGHRAASLLRRGGVETDRVYPGPTSVGGITRLLLRLAEDVLDTWTAEGLESFSIVSSRFEGVGVTAPVRTQLLPLERSTSALQVHSRYVEREQLVASVVREYFFITLYDLLLDGLASEHGARLLATQSAERWLRDRVERLHRRLAATRREASTQEMIEIAAATRTRQRMNMEGD